MQEVILQVDEDQRYLFRMREIDHDEQPLDDDIAEAIDAPVQVRFDEDGGVLLFEDGGTLDHRVDWQARVAHKPKPSCQRAVDIDRPLALLRLPRCCRPTGASFARSSFGRRPITATCRFSTRIGDSIEQSAISLAIAPPRTLASDSSMDRRLIGLPGDRHCDGVRLAEIEHVAGRRARRAPSKATPDRSSSRASPASTLRGNLGIESGQIDLVERAVHRLHEIVPHVGDDAAERRGDAGIRRDQRRLQSDLLHERACMQGRRRRRTASARSRADCGRARSRPDGSRRPCGCWRPGRSPPPPRPDRGRADRRSGVLIAAFAASTSRRLRPPPIGRSGLMRPRTTLASVSVGRSLPWP